MRILFVANSKKPVDPIAGASTRYRCWYRIEDFRRQGFQAWLTTLDRVQTSTLNNFDFIQFQRPEYNKKLNACLEYCRNHSIPSAVDFDDLIFDPDIWDQSPAYLCGRTSKNAVVRAHKSYLKALRSFKLVTVSSEPLAAAVLQLHPDAQVYVIRNGVGLSWHGDSQDSELTNRPSISYFSGNHSHDHDFKMITPSLVDYMHSNTEVELHLYGYLNVDHEYLDQSRTHVHPYYHYTALPTLIERHTVTVAPLVANQFNDCKSAIKILESATLGVPCISTIIEDVERFDHEGLIHVQGDDWTDVLQQSISIGSQETLRNSLRQYAETHCLSSAGSEQLARLIDQKTKACGKPLSLASTGLNINNMFVAPSTTQNEGGVLQDKEPFFWLTKRRVRKLIRDPIGYLSDSIINPKNWISKIRNF